MQRAHPGWPKRGNYDALVRPAVFRGIGKALHLSQQTVTNMRQNLSFSFLYNSIGVPIAAGVLYPVTGLLLSPMIAALAMSLSSLSVVSNALRLRIQE